jgi:hypothetical protein
MPPTHLSHGDVLYLRCDRLVDRFLEKFGQYFCRKSNNRRGAAQAFLSSARHGREFAGYLGGDLRDSGRSQRSHGMFHGTSARGYPPSSPAGG